MKKLLFCILFFGKFSAHAQIPNSPNCPPVQTTGDTVEITGSASVSCGIPVTLNAIAYSAQPTTDAYTVTSVPYTPFPFNNVNTPLTNNFGNTVALETVDDTWSTVIGIPFPFCFFGTKYDSLLIGSNGNISFNTILASGFNAFSFTALTMPNNNTTWNNSICAPHSDIHPQPGSGSTIKWEVYGTAPCRAFVASWDSVAYFPSTTCTSFRTAEQIVLYEGTNIIDCNIKYKQLCLANSSNGSTAHQGIQDATGTVAYTVPGHNGGQWTDSTSTWRFTPSGIGANSFTYTWFNAATGAQIGTGNTVTVSPLASTNYYVVANLACSGATVVDSYFVTVANPIIADFTTDVHLGCTEDTVNFVSTSVNATNFSWQFGNGSTSLSTNPTNIYPNQGIFNVTLIVSNTATCIDTIVKTINLNHPINAAFTTNFSGPPSFDSMCVGKPITINNFSVGGGLLHTFTMGNGVTIIKNNNAPFNYTYPLPGVYTILLTVQDTLGCIDTFTRKIYVDNAPFAQLKLTDSNICLGEPVFFNDSVAPYTKAFTYDFGDGISLQNVHDPAHTYQSAINSPYTVTFTADFLICPDLVITKKVDVTNFPIVNLGPDTSICPGLTAPITINSNTLANNYLWSSGETLPYITTSKAGYFWLRAGNKDCYATDSVWVKEDCYINIPNSFTPGNDGLNNYFMPTSELMSGVTAYSLNIYNRWGELVFFTNNINSKGWDGKFGDKPQPMGTYVYNIKVSFRNNLSKEYTGNVTLLR